MYGIHVDYMCDPKIAAVRIGEGGVLAIVSNAIFLEPKLSGETFADESDRVFYEVALAGQDDDTRLVTGNLRHYPVSPIVVTPAQMIAIIEERFSQS